MKIAIIGAGIAGLAAAFDLLNAGHEVTLYEANSYTGGLAAGFRDETWDWSLEHFYHHLFKSDRDILQLVESLGIADKVFFPRPITSVIYKGQIEPFDSPLAWIKFPGFNLLDVVRFGLVGAYLRFSKPWRTLEKETAVSWLRRWYGTKIYNMIWRPLLIGKFGPYYKEANMAWMWARVHVRSMSLGYFEGGFKIFIDRLTAVVQEKGGVIHLDCPIQAITPTDSGRFTLTSHSHEASYDRVLATTSPHLLSKLAPDLPDDYLAQLLQLKSMGAVVMTLALKRPLLTKHHTYWLNLPAETADKSQNEYPFLALVEHTNYIDKAHYGGDHIIYCGDYVTPDHPYLSMSKEELAAKFVAALVKFNPDFKPDWVRKSWLHKATYAQPVPMVNHARNIPAIRTPLAGLYFASMSQVYPWDRGTNFAVQIGRQAAQQILADATPAARGYALAKPGRKLIEQKEQ